MFVQSASVLSLRITRNYWPTSPVLLPEPDFVAKSIFITSYKRMFKAFEQQSQSDSNWKQRQDNMQ